MISCRLFRDGRAVDDPVDAADIDRLIADEHNFVWLDVVDPTEEELAVLQEEFGLHPLTVEDSLHRHQRPKVELFGDYAFLVLRPLALGTDDQLDELELHAFVSRRYLATLRYDAAFAMEQVVRRWERQPELLALGGGFAAYVLVDEVVDDYLTIVEAFEDLADDLEDDVFSDEEDGGVAPQQRIFRLKREVVRLRRFAMPLRQGLDLLLEEPRFAGAPIQPYYRDVMDHAIRVVELADNIRDLLTSLLEVRVSQVANNLNEIMKKLTSWAAIILIPTLIAGVYGMNFRSMPELHWAIGYPLALGMMGLSSFALYRLFRRRGWL